MTKTPQNWLQTGPVIRDGKGRFKPGSRANPGGRPRRAREISDALDQLTLPMLLRAYQKGEEGDVSAMKLVLDRGAPVRRSIAFPN